MKIPKKKFHFFLLLRMMKVMLLVLVALVSCSIAASVNPPVFVSQYLPNNYAAGQNASKVSSFDYLF